MTWIHSNPAFAQRLQRLVKCNRQKNDDQNVRDRVDHINDTHHNHIDPAKPNRQWSRKGTDQQDDGGSHKTLR